MDAPKPAIVFLEGNIGAGKSTLLKAIAATGTATVHLEPVDDWAKMLDYIHDMNEQPEDQRRPHGYGMQSAVLDWFSREIRDVLANGTGLHVFERSPDACAQVFGPYWESRGLLSPSQARHIEHLLGYLKSDSKYEDLVRATVYLDTPAGACEDRARSRGDRESVQRQIPETAELYEKLATDRQWPRIDSTRPTEEQLVAFMRLVA